MPTIKKTCLSIIVLTMMLPALAGLLVQLNLYAPSALYKPGMALLEVGVIVAALAVAAFWPSTPSSSVASDEEEEDYSPEEHERIRASRGARD